MIDQAKYRECADRVSARARVSNPTIWTGRTRRWFLFWKQYQMEGPVYANRDCTPFNVDKWPRGRWWTFDRPEEVAF